MKQSTLKLLILGTLFASISWSVLATPGAGFFYDSGVTNLPATAATVLFDIDGDGDLDLFFWDGAPGGYELFKNDGHGVFTATGQTFNSQTSSRHIAAVDIDNDGDLDLVIVPDDGPKEIWLNDGKGNFSLARTFGTTVVYPDRIGAMTVADVNNDGRPDIIISERSARNIAQVWINQGGGQMTQGQTLIMPIRRL